MMRIKWGLDPEHTSVLYLLLYIVWDGSRTSKSQGRGWSISEDLSASSHLQCGSTRAKKLPSVDAVHIWLGLVGRTKRTGNGKIKQITDMRNMGNYFKMHLQICYYSQKYTLRVN